MKSVIERECLKEAQLKVDSEIFEQTLYEYDQLYNPSDENNKGKKRTMNPYKYELEFPLLLAPAPLPSPVIEPVAVAVKGSKADSKQQKTSIILSRIQLGKLLWNACIYLFL